MRLARLEDFLSLSAGNELSASELAFVQAADALGNSAAGEFLRKSGGALVNATPAGGGTVTTVSVATANGFSGTVANATTTPAITIIAGAITPTSVNGLTLASQSVGFTIAGGTTSKTLTVPLDATVSGTNTGDQTAVSGNAGTATALQNARTIGGVSFDGTANITVASATGGFTVSGGNLALGTNSITMSGSIGVTGTRVTKGWFTDLEVTNAIVGSVTGNAATVTTNANLTGVITSSGNATSIASQTGTGTKFVVDTSPVLVTPNVGVATATSINKVALTAPATSATLTIADGKTVTHNATTTFAGTDGKTLTVSNSITVAGTDSTVMTFPSTSATIARTDAANTFTGASTASAWVLTSPTITTKVSPTTDDGAPLGDTTHNFSDLFLATGAVINVANGNWAATHSSGILTVTTGDLRVTSANVGTNGDSVPTLASTSTFTNKTLTSPTLTTPSAFTTGGTITLAENTSIALDPAGSADGKWTGISVTATAGYTQAFGDCVYLDPTDSRWELCDANSAAGADGDSRGIIGMVVSTGTDGTSCTILLNGIIRADAKFPTFTVNNPIYVSETAGAVTQTQPTTTDVVIRVLGFGITGDEMYFNPDNTYITHT